MQYITQYTVAAAIGAFAAGFMVFVVAYLWGWVDGQNRRKRLDGSATYIPYKNKEWDVDGYILVYSPKAVMGDDE